MEATETQFDSDQFLKLLTEALRAGPGSPQWHEAVNQLKNSSIADADEYRMLINAREHLESGRDYRSIRAGPGFTRKVMSAIDEEAAAAAQSPAPSSASTIALLAAALIVAVIVTVAVIWYRGGPPQPTSDLANTVFPQTIISTDFTQTQTIPPEWRTLGLAPNISTRSRGLAAPYVKAAADDDKDHRGGGIYSPSGIAPTQSFAFEVAVKQYRVSENVVQIFITDTPDFDKNPKASSPHELVCYLLKGTISIAKPDGSIQGSGTKANDTNHIQIKLDKQFVVIENDGQTLYSGKHDLSPEKARYPGVRFLVKPSEKPLEDLTVPSVRILKP